MSKIFIRLVMLLAVVLTSQTASAAIEPNGVLDEVAVRFMTASATWGHGNYKLCRLAVLDAGYYIPCLDWRDLNP